MNNKGLRRFFVDEIETTDGSSSITGSEARHITRVLRMGRGDRLVLMDSKGARFQALIESASPKEVRVVLEKRLPRPPPSSVDITLCQAVLKSRSMDYLIQKTSELGVDLILPFTSKRTVVRLDEKGSTKKVQRWREIAQAAAKQSDRAIPAKIRSITLFEELMATCEGKDVLQVILWEEEGARDLKDMFKASSSIKKFVGVVGPEGGFTQQEISLARDAGFIPVSLGNKILRAETAALTLVAIAQYECGGLSLG